MADTTDTTSNHNDPSSDAPVDTTLGSLRFEDQPQAALPDDAWQRFLEGADALGVNLLSEQRPVIENLYRHLVGVNRWLNLTRITEPDGFLTSHVLDSLSATPHAVFDELSEKDVCLDLGSGGGYPGLVLMTCYQAPQWYLVDSRKKKVDFLAEAVKLTPCERAKSAHFRGREVRNAYPEVAGKVNLIVSRAVGQMDKLLEECQYIIKKGGHVLVYKGPSYAGEEHERALKAAKRFHYSFVDVNEVELTPEDGSRYIVTFRKH